VDRTRSPRLTRAAFPGERTLLAPCPPRQHNSSMRPTFAILAAAAALSIAGCSHDNPTGPGSPAPGVRGFRMGFSAVPPRNDFPSLLASLDQWTRRADAAVIQSEAPWDSLLDGARPDSIVLRNVVGLAEYYKSKHLEITVVLDPENGLDRAADSDPLTARGRSLTEPAIQQLFRAYAVAVDSLVQPTHMELAVETNLIRAAASPALYAAVKQVANDAAADVRARDANVRLGVTVQVDVAWWRLNAPSSPPVYAGVAQDLADFPFAQEFGMSSYPYLAGFAQPEDVPADYFARVEQEVGRAVFASEGGWTSASVGAVVSSPEVQARWIRREPQMLSDARASAWFQLTYTDLGASVTGAQPPGSILPLFAHLGLVDTLLVAKPALGPWDSTFARSRSPLAAATAGAVLSGDPRRRSVPTRRTP